MEAFWNKLYDEHNKIIGNPLTPSVIIFFAYFAVAIPFVVLDSFKGIKQRKIQPGKYATRQQIYAAIWDYLFCELCVYVPLTALSVMFADTEKVDVVRRELPSVSEFVTDIFKIYLLMDFLFYTVHYALHTKFLYKNIHYKHHTHRSPFVFATQSHHWIESILMGMVTTIPVYTFSRHVLTQWLALLMTLIHGVVIHSGYDTGMEKLTRGFLAFSKFHDNHHRFVTSNYGAYTMLYDRLFGTSCSVM